MFHYLPTVADTNTLDRNQDPFIPSRAEHRHHLLRPERRAPSTVHPRQRWQWVPGREEGNTGASYSDNRHDQDSVFQDHRGKIDESRESAHQHDYWPGQVATQHREIHGE